MSQAAHRPDTLTREKPLGRKRTAKPETPPPAPADDKPKRSRAREAGTVVPLGVEVEAPLYNAVEACRRRRQWSKRTLIENALKMFLAQEGDWPPPAAPE